MSNINKEKNRAMANSSITNCLMDSMVVKGDINSKKDIIIAGQLTGNLVCNQTVIVRTKGVIKGNVTAQNIVVQGLIDGQALIKNNTHIKQNGIIKGRITTQKLIIEEGATFGKITFAET